MRKRAVLKWWQIWLDRVNEVLGYFAVFFAGMIVMFMLIVFAHWHRWI